MLTKSGYIIIDTCPPFLLVNSGVFHREIHPARPPRVGKKPVALLKTPGVSPPRPAAFYRKTMPARGNFTVPAGVRGREKEEG